MLTETTQLANIMVEKTQDDVQHPK